MFDLLKTHREIAPQHHGFDAVPPKMGPVPPRCPPGAPRKKRWCPLLASAILDILSVAFAAQRRACQRFTWELHRRVAE